MDERNYDLEDIPSVMDIQPYMFEPPACSVCQSRKFAAK